MIVIIGIIYVIIVMEHLHLILQMLVIHLVVNPSNESYMKMNNIFTNGSNETLDIIEPNTNYYNE